MRSLFPTLPIALFLAAAPATGAILLSENFEGSFPAPNWIGDFSGAVVTDPTNSSNKALHFTSYGSGGDLFSKALTYPLGIFVEVDFDFLNEGTSATNTGAYVGTNHGCCSFNDEQWVFPNLTAPIGTWTHFSQIFLVHDTASVGNFNLKLEQGSSGQPIGSMYFDNIVVASIPEPATFGLMGIGLAAFLRCRRRI